MTARFVFAVLGVLLIAGMTNAGYQTVAPGLDHEWYGDTDYRWHAAVPVILTLSDKNNGDIIDVRMQVPSAKFDQTFDYHTFAARQHANSMLTFTLDLGNTGSIAYVNACFGRVEVTGGPQDRVVLDPNMNCAVDISGIESSNYVVPAITFSGRRMEFNLEWHGIVPVPSLKSLPSFDFQPVTGPRATYASHIFGMVHRVDITGEQGTISIEEPHCHSFDPSTLPPSCPRVYLSLTGKGSATTRLRVAGRDQQTAGLNYDWLTIADIPPDTELEYLASRKRGSVDIYAGHIFAGTSTVTLFDFPAGLDIRDAQGQ